MYLGDPNIDCVLIEPLQPSECRIYDRDEYLGIPDSSRSGQWCIVRSSESCRSWTRWLDVYQKEKFDVVLIKDWLKPELYNPSYG